MKIRPIVGMRLEPEMLPNLIATYARAATDMTAVLANVDKRGRLWESWAADDVSEAMRLHYNGEIMDGEHSAYAALRDYRQELQNITDILKQMLSDYQRTESDTTARPKHLDPPSA